ncbi:A disintegrin and metalloproteinase with thrombospondin motifs adt-1-like isoform X1 [Mytilus galloprovincialis]|uniref:A disintegrin and metalloproteinase with thrombospondin motifs adt-1-like isoform X1 n=1 Tax=Mytilus galloprovincialis TaxID=29158 RepID=UPI003F7BCA0F
MLIFGNNLLIVILFFKPSDCTSLQESDNCMCSEWSEWTDYTSCSAHCGSGIKSRNRLRKCDDDNIDTTQATICINNSTQYQVCNTQECGCEKICSSWSGWSEGKCSLMCGGGTLTATRTRQCHGSIGCIERDQASKPCNTQPCVGCSCDLWSQWSDFGLCSSMCGHGEQTRNRTRECAPKLQCLGASTEYASSHCNLGVCCNDACTPWSPWRGLTCSTTCDYGTAKLRRTRICALPSCNDTEDSIGECKTRTCTETCDSTCTQWGTWTWFPCTQSCNGGTRIRQRIRTCTFPDCLGEDIHSATCNNFKCIECNDTLACSVWSNWIDGDCSESCDVGKQIRTRNRTCIIPECKAEDAYEEICKRKTCEETCDSTCSAWSDWYQGRCSQTCDEGSLLQHRNRTCIHDDCQNIEKKSLPCLNQKPCPATCNKYCSLWTGWKSFDCSVMCGGGTLIWTRVRQCDHSECQPTETTTSLCNTQNCDEKCDLICSKWSAWSLMGECSASCGVGTQAKSRKRLCSQDDCVVADQQLDSCMLSTCPDQCTGECSTWSDWGDGICSVTCGNGTKVSTRNRTCNLSICTTEETKFENCTELQCSEHIDCDVTCDTWSNWLESLCSTSCDYGIVIKNRTRACNAYMDTCPGVEIMSERCRNTTCPETCDIICTSWSDWYDEECSASCDIGSTHRVRTRQCPESDCKISNVIMVPCQKMSCSDIIQDDQEHQHVTTSSNPCQQGTALYIVHPSDCTKFIQCSNGQNFEMQCPQTTGWNPLLNACDHKRNIPGCT